MPLLFLILQLRYVRKRNYRCGIGIGFKDHDLIVALFEQGCGNVQRFLRACGVEISADIEAVDRDKALGKAVKADKGILGRLIQMQIAAQEGMVACFSNTGRVRMAAEALLREVSEQRKIMLAFSKLLGGMEEKR
jgi:hypothetical protein